MGLRCHAQGGVGSLPIDISEQMMQMLSLQLYAAIPSVGDFTLICYPAALIMLLNNLRFLFILSSVLSFVLWLDGGQRMRAELLFVRGIDFWFFCR